MDQQSFIFSLLIFVLFLLIGLSPKNIVEVIGDSLKTLEAKKIAKRLNMVDKGQIPQLLIVSTDPVSKKPVRTKARVLCKFCGSPVRIAILNKNSVKWCSTCEYVFPLGKGDDGDHDSPEGPVPPDVQDKTDDILDRIKNGTILNRAK